MISFNVNLIWCDLDLVVLLVDTFNDVLVCNVLLLLVLEDVNNRLKNSLKLPTLYQQQKKLYQKNHLRLTN